MDNITLRKNIFCNIYCIFTHIIFFIITRQIKFYIIFLKKSTFGQTTHHQRVISIVSGAPIKSVVPS